MFIGYFKVILKNKLTQKYLKKKNRTNIALIVNIDQPLLFQLKTEALNMNF